jgi:hypothetical protein
LPAALGRWCGCSYSLVGCLRTVGLDHEPLDGRVEPALSCLVVRRAQPVIVKPFKNGARPVIQVTLRQDRPHEVGFTVWSARDSAAMKACVLTATMGNYARLRQLWLKDKVVHAATLWNPFQPDAWGFAAPRTFGLEHLLVLRGEALVAATPGEVGSDTGTEKVPSAWRYEGRIATQYWRATPVPGLCVRINGRKRFGRQRHRSPVVCPMRTSSWKHHSAPGNNSILASHRSCLRDLGSSIPAERVPDPDRLNPLARRCSIPADAASICLSLSPATVRVPRAVRCVQPLTAG